MKKIFAIATLVLAFGFSAKAQDKKAAPKEVTSDYKMEVLNQVEGLKKVINFDQQLKNDMITLLIDRKEAMKTVTSPEDKKAVFTKYGLKAFGGFSKEQLDLLRQKNPTLYSDLMEYKE